MALQQESVLPVHSTAAGDEETPSKYVEVGSATSPAPSLTSSILETPSTGPSSIFEGSTNLASIVENRTASSTFTKFDLEDHPVDITPSLRVAVIGAGIIGISAGVLLPAKVPGIKLKIFDKNADVGGVWFENVYPGVRCDIPANVYQSGFAPKTQWTEEYAQGAEIREYWQDIAKKHNIYQHLHLEHRITYATWDEDKGEWSLTINNLATGDTYEERFDVIITAIGRFNAWRLPDYPGIEDYEGHLRHSSAWDPAFDPTGKAVAVIGNGASGLQVVPNLQPIVKHMDHYARSKTWIAGSFNGAAKGRTMKPQYYAKDVLKSFEDPDTYVKFRKELEATFYERFAQVFRGTEENKGLAVEFAKLMADRVKDKPELIDQLIPDFPPLCRRLTPGPGYLEALTKSNVSYITTPISHFTKTGIVTADDVERDVDAVICSTGANIDMRPPFPVIGRDGKNLYDAWTPDPITYIGIATPSFPNLLFLGGPNAAGYSGTVPNNAETQITYIAKLLRKVGREGIKTFAPSQAATDDFMEYSDTFFAKTVWTDNCSSWANGGRPGGRIHGHWAGSASHVNFIRKDPRWEDFEWTSKSETGNRFAWFGNGWTEKESVEGRDVVAYIKRPDQIDLRTFHEEWFE